MFVYSLKIYKLPVAVERPFLFGAPWRTKNFLCVAKWLISVMTYKNCLRDVITDILSSVMEIYKQGFLSARRGTQRPKMVHKNLICAPQWRAHV